MIPLLADVIRVSGGVFGLLIFVLDIVAIVSLLTGKGTVAHKVLWIVLILLFPCLGVVLYFLFGRSPLDA